MKYEHVIVIAEVAGDRETALTRRQLWDGLVLRAKTPQLFMPQLDDCEIEEKEGLSRRLHYGERVVCDRVRFVPMESVHIHVPSQDEIPESFLTITIEESPEEGLAVRFIYEDNQPAAPDALSHALLDLRKSAYREADYDTVRIILERSVLH